MRLAIISDTHLGDSECVLVKRDLSLGDKFDAFVNAVGKNDYLVLLGDIFDFALSSYADVYKIAEVFLQKVRDHDIAKQIVYVPGNHDFEFWHILEHEVNIINKIRKQHKDPEEFRWSVPGVFDDRQQREEDKFSLPDVTPAPGITMEKYGDVFLSDIVSPRLIFNVAYPVCFIVDQKGESVLLTHGHYLEPFWALAGEWALKIAKKELKLSDADKKQLCLKTMVAMNFPLCQFASSGLGQAGPLTRVVRDVQREVKDKKLDDVEEYLKKLDDLVLDKAFGYGPLNPCEWVTDFLISKARKRIIKKLKEFKPARFNDEFVDPEKPEVRERFANFYRSCIREIERLKNPVHGRAVDIPKPPGRMIFGHTHIPVSWDKMEYHHNVDGNDVYLHNTGGWLTRIEGDTKEFCGASIFFYETGHGFSYKSVE